MWHLEERGCFVQIFSVLGWDALVGPEAEEEFQGAWLCPVQPGIPAGWGGKLPGVPGAGGVHLCVWGKGLRICAYSKKYK